jgi:hypothetical protein
MRFMVMVKATAESEKEGARPDPQLMAEMGKYNGELMKAGVLLALDGLHPSSKGARVKFPASLAPSSTALSRRPRSSSPASGCCRSSPSKRPSSGSSVAPTATPATPKSKSARSLRWRNSPLSCPKSRSSTKYASALSSRIRPAKIAGLAPPIKSWCDRQQSPLSIHIRPCTAPAKPSGRVAHPVLWSFKACATPSIGVVHGNKITVGHAPVCCCFWRTAECSMLSAEC